MCSSCSLPTNGSSRLRKNAAKLVPAYVLFALIVYVAKALAVRVLHVDRPVSQVFSEVLLMLAYPTEGFAQFLWFIVTLLMILAVITASANLDHSPPWNGIGGLSLRCTCFQSRGM